MGTVPHPGLICHICGWNKNEKKKVEPSALGLGVHMRTHRNDRVTYHQWNISWNDQIYVTFENCPICLGIIEDDVYTHFTGRNKQCMVKEKPDWIPYALQLSLRRVDSREFGICMHWETLKKFILDVGVGDRLHDYCEKDQWMSENFVFDENLVEASNCKKIYILVDHVNRIIYIGQTIMAICSRIYCHKNSNERVCSNQLGTLLAQRKCVYSIIGRMKDLDCDKKEDVLKMERIIWQWFKVNTSYGVANLC